MPNEPRKAYKLIHWFDAHEPKKLIKGGLSYWIQKVHAGRGRRKLMQIARDSEEAFAAVGFFNVLQQRTAKLPRSERGWILDGAGECATLAQLSHEYCMPFARVERLVYMLQKCNWVALLNFDDARNRTGSRNSPPIRHRKTIDNNKGRTSGHAPGVVVVQARKEEEKLTTTTQPDDPPAAPTIAEALRDFGVSEPIAERLGRDYPAARIKSTLAHAAAHGKRPGFVVSALEGGWDLGANGGPAPIYDRDVSAELRSQAEERERLSAQRARLMAYLQRIGEQELARIEALARDRMPDRVRRRIPDDATALNNGTVRAFVASVLDDAPDKFRWHEDPA